MFPADGSKAADIGLPTEPSSLECCEFKGYGVACATPLDRIAFNRMLWALAWVAVCADMCPRDGDDEADISWLADAIKKLACDIATPSFRDSKPTTEPNNCTPIIINRNTRCAYAWDDETGEYVVIGGSQATISNSAPTDEPNDCREIHVDRTSKCAYVWDEGAGEYIQIGSDSVSIGNTLPSGDQGDCHFMHVDRATGCAYVWDAENSEYIPIRAHLTVADPNDPYCGEIRKIGAIGDDECAELISYLPEDNQIGTFAFADAGGSHLPTGQGGYLIPDDLSLNNIYEWQEFVDAHGNNTLNEARVNASAILEACFENPCQREICFDMTMSRALGNDAQDAFERRARLSWRYSVDGGAWNYLESGNGDATGFETFNAIDRSLDTIISRPVPPGEICYQILYFPVDENQPAQLIANTHTVGSGTSPLPRMSVYPKNLT